MKKRVVGVLLSVAMVSALMAGCGDSKETAAGSAGSSASSKSTASASSSGAGNSGNESTDSKSAGSESTDSKSTSAGSEAASSDTATYSDLELTDEEKASAKGLTIGVTYCTSSAPAVKVFAQGIQEEAKELGIELIELDGNFDAATQADQMNTFISQKVDGIVLNPSDGTSLVSSCKNADEAGIPVVTGAMNVDDSGYEYIRTFVGPDDKDVGRIAGQTMMEALGDKGGKVAIIEGTAGSSAQVNRTEGFEEAVAGSAVEVVAKNAADYDEATAMGIAEDLLTKYSDLAGIFCHDDTMASGVAQAMKELGYTGSDLVVVGYGGSAKGAELVQEGYLVATAVQPLVDEGRGCIKALVKAINGEELSAWYKDEITPLSKDNVESYDKSLLW